ncbi:efflux RND transporter periplasmic adaptor subunit [Yoonia sediminilitoris]|uniref:HlyD family secretion protein n=1 Tax=Yoonia sediminilitoris TaxID=1286148 RepID=A0A2T6K8P4_9RHOB|nr:efflux RND transporter periplasmic adaptor subunit [Yoonia sediminilitoris]PUB11097.1 HlyD family secretion protein [Yoonia sediminilitoris]RCW91016.1 HlyD family secretion protein [Yoonia sediminilitoris]
MNVLKTILRILIAVFFIAIVAVGYREYSSQPKAKTTYMTSPVVEGTLNETITATGSLNAVVTVEVGSQLSGRIAELLVDFNDPVTSGQPVAHLDPGAYLARHAEADAALQMARANAAVKEAELNRAQAQLEDAHADLEVLTARLAGAQARFDAATAALERMRTLETRNLITSEEFEQAELELKVEAAGLEEALAIVEAHAIAVKVSKADVRRQKADLMRALANIPQKEALLNLAEIELDRTVIRSPINGIVIGRDVSQGQTVAASLEAPTLFTIAQDLTEMEIHARIDETDIGKVKPGQSASFTVDAFPDRTFEGTVKLVRKAPEAVQNVVTYTVIIGTQNTGQLLLPGMTANIRLLVMESEPLVKIPRAALDFMPDNIASQSGNYPQEGTVWVLNDNGDPRPVEVEIGANDRTYAAILDASLTPGEQVITNAFQQEAERWFLGIRIGF